MAIVEGWEVSQRRSTGALTVSDRTPWAKVLVHAAESGPYSRTAAVRFGRAARGGGVLEIGSGVGEWLLLGPVGAARELMAHVSRPGRMTNWSASSISPMAVPWCA